MDKKVDYKKLRNLRVDKDKTQKEMAAILNVVPSAYSRIERGERDIRVEQLQLIAEALGQNINDFLINSTGRESNNQEIKSETQLLESIICFLGSEIESEVISIYHKYVNNCDSHPYPYELYIKGDDWWACPKYAVADIKKLIKEYEHFISDPVKWHRERIRNLKEFDDLIGDKAEREIPADCERDYHFNQFFGQEQYQYFKKLSDEELYSFVCAEENYNFIYAVVLHFVHYTKPEDAYNAFRDMLWQESMVKSLFQSGLLEKSSFSFDWERYLKEEKPIPISVKTTVGKLAMENVREKLRDIFSRNDPYAQ